MSKIKLFDLEKIKEITEPTEILQDKISEANEIDSLMENLENLVGNFSNNEEFSKPAKEIIISIKDINRFFKNIFNSNLNIYFSLQDKLFDKYKAQLKDIIQKSELNPTVLKKLGLYLIDTKKISRIPKRVSFLKSIGINKWIELLDVLKDVSTFHKIIKSSRVYYEKIVNQRLNNELENIPSDVNSNLVLKFKELFLQNPQIKFTDFIKNIEEQVKHSKLTLRESIIKERKEREKLEELKKTQQERKTEYQDYLMLSEKEFERKIRKKKRGKLSELVKNKKSDEEIKISDEISEKIEKFKSQFDENLKEKFLASEENDKDPIDLIRARNKKKKEEFTKYKDHFDNV